MKVLINTFIETKCSKPKSIYVDCSGANRRELRGTKLPKIVSKSISKIRIEYKNI